MVSLCCVIDTPERSSSRSAGLDSKMARTALAYALNFCPGFDDQFLKRVAHCLYFRVRIHESGISTDVPLDTLAIGYFDGVPRHACTDGNVLSIRYEPSP
jgi:hypothetical protein